MELSTLVLSYSLINNMLTDYNYNLSLRNVHKLLLASTVIYIKYNESLNLIINPMLKLGD